MKLIFRLTIFIVFTAGAVACASEAPAERSEDALATALTPQFPPEYYVEQAHACPIYEEFVFNDQGEMTFIEAWSDQPGLLPMPDPDDRWAEASDALRLSTKVPGLGNETGLIDLDSEGMQRAAAEDPGVADFVRRARDFWAAWLEATEEAGTDYYARGCGWVE